jgi:TonB family protein
MRLLNRHFISSVLLIALNTFSPGQNVPRASIRLMEEQLRERIRSETPPKYPPAARAAKLQGLVVTEVEFDGKGDVTKIEILESTDPLFATATKTALKRWKFSPIVSPDNETLSGKGKLTFYFYYKDGRGWSEDPSIFKQKTK